MRIDPNKPQPKRKPVMSNTEQVMQVVKWGMIIGAVWLAANIAGYHPNYSTQSLEQVQKESPKIDAVPQLSQEEMQANLAAKRTEAINAVNGVRQSCETLNDQGGSSDPKLLLICAKYGINIQPVEATVEDDPSYENPVNEFGEGRIDASGGKGLDTTDVYIQGSAVSCYEADESGMYHTQGIDKACNAAGYTRQSDY